VLALERLRLSDLREMNALQGRLNQEIDAGWRLREQLAREKQTVQQDADDEDPVQGLNNVMMTS
jgi:hypothetical protein